MQNGAVEDRKIKEAEFHNRREVLRTSDPGEYAEITRNRRFYSINRSSKDFMDNWLRTVCRPGTQVLDYCCGTGGNSVLMAKAGASVTCLDISADSIASAREALESQGLSARFVVGDAEHTEFPDSTFDVILCNGVLHHLDVTKAFPELARILKPSGKVFCVEALAHNPIFQLYRRATPHMRTAWEVEHILSRREIWKARQFFGTVQPNFFHLAALAAVPFRDKPSLFDRFLKVCEAADGVLLKIPGLRWWAWQCLFILSNPKKG